MSQSHHDEIKVQLKNIPKKAGVYQFSDSEGKVIYVGKAKNLKSRVSSYFNKVTFESAKTKILVRKISDLKYFVVNSEYEALLLENNMIKKYQPRYNILLKDDKTYPFICVKNERFPRVFSTRNVIRDGSVYFGPYASVKMVNTLLELIRQLYPLRNCTYNLSEKNVDQKKFKVCLEYHVKNCLGACEGLQSEESYLESIRDIKEILKGHSTQVIDHLKVKMKKYADNLEYENAESVRSKLNILSNFKGKSTVVNPKISNLDVFSLVDDVETVYVNFIRVVKGAVVQGHTVEMKRNMDERADEILPLAIAELRQRFQSDSKEIVLPFKIGIEFPNVKITVPQRGDKRDLLKLSERNARFFMLDKLKRMEQVDPESYSKKLMNQMKEDLRLPSLPVQIECFDNSNIQGSDAVAACVVFKNAKPAKSEYRHFNIKTVDGPDDFASMTEIVFRRYKRLLDEKKDLPQLIVIDGGKGQLSAAVESLDKLGIRGVISIIGIAKKLEEIYFPDDPIPLYLDKRSTSLKLIQHLRNEAHRFGIQHHRNKRSKTSLKTELSGIKGIGPETEKILLRTFKSMKKIRELSIKQIAEITGQKKAELIHRHIH